MHIGNKTRNSARSAHLDSMPDGRRERSRTWSNCDRDRYRRRETVCHSRSSSLAEIEQENIAAASAKLLSQSYHAGQSITLSVTNVDDEDKSKHRRMSRFSAPRNSVQAPSQSYLLTPRLSIIQRGTKSGFRKNSRTSVVSNDDSSSTSSSSICPPKSAWEQFSDHIKEIDDSSQYFNQNNRIYKRSDTFIRCCSAMDYKLPSDNDSNCRKESLDVESVLDLPFSNEPRLSIASTCRSAGRGRNDSVVELLTDLQDPRSRSSTPSNVLSVCQERDSESSEDSEEEGEGIHIPSGTQDKEALRRRRRKKSMKAELQPVSHLVEERKPEARKELYKRYLYNPDTWTVGLQKYLKKSIIREKTNKFSNASHQYPMPVYRPKAILLAADKKPNSASKRRVLSANYPACDRIKTRAPSAISTMSRFREAPPLV